MPVLYEDRLKKKKAPFRPKEKDTVIFQGKHMTVLYELPKDENGRRFKLEGPHGIVTAAKADMKPYEPNLTQNFFSWASVPLAK